jgi:hypothetical protein
MLSRLRQPSGSDQLFIFDLLLLPDATVTLGRV